MTKDELKKRLFKIKGQPLQAKVSPRETRKDVTQVEVKSEFEESDFDSFFEFEEELAEMESARKQMERLNQVSSAQPMLAAQPEEAEEESFVMFEEEIEEESSKLGDDSSFFSFQEASDETDIEEKKFEFKYCKYIKNNGEGCKRQAPKKGEYCASHRKMLAKGK